jgi:hypothetical protein
VCVVLLHCGALCCAEKVQQPVAKHNPTAHRQQPHREWAVGQQGDPLQVARLGQGRVKGAAEKAAVRGLREGRRVLGGM